MIEIAGRGLRRALHAALGRLKSNERSFDKAELAGLTSLSWADYGEAEAYPDRWTTMRSIEGLEHCTSLEELALSGNQVRSLEPLAQLPALRELWLQTNAISDLQPLAGTTTLTLLNVRDNPITSLAALRTCTGLTHVDLEGTEVTDLEPLASCTALVELTLSKTQPLDLSPLLGMKSLTTVRYQHTSGFSAVQLDAAVALVEQGVTLEGPIRREAKAHASSDSIATTNDPMVKALRALGRDDLAADWFTHGLEADFDEARTWLHEVVAEVRSNTPLEPVFTLIQGLVEAGVDPNALDGMHERTALEALLGTRTNVPVVDALLAAGTNPNAGPENPALSIVVGYRNPELREALWRRLLEHGADPTHPKILPLAIAKWPEQVPTILELGADVNAGLDRYVPLHAAVKANNLELAQLLLERGADPNQVAWSIIPFRPVHRVSSLAMLELLAKAGADITARDAHGVTLLHKLAESMLKPRFEDADAKLAEMTTMVDLLLNAGISIHDAQSNGSVLVKNISGRNGYGTETLLIPFVEILLARGADPLCPCAAYSEYNKPLMNVLLKHGAAKEGYYDQAQTAVDRMGPAEAMQAGDLTFRSLGTLIEGDKLDTLPEPEPYLERLIELLAADQHPAAQLLCNATEHPNYHLLAVAWLHGGWTLLGEDVLTVAMPDFSLVESLLQAGLSADRTDARGGTLIEALLGVKEEVPESLLQRAMVPIAGTANQRGFGSFSSYHRRRAVTQDRVSKVWHLVERRSPNTLEGILHLDRADLLEQIPWDRALRPAAWLRKAQREKATKCIAYLESLAIR